MVRRLRQSWVESNALPLAAIGWSYLAYAFALHAFRIQTPPVCIFHLLTGHPCPLCGMTRAFGRLMAGDVVGATHFNAFAIPVFIIWLAISVAYTAQSLAGIQAQRGAVLSNYFHS